VCPLLDTTTNQCVDSRAYVLVHVVGPPAATADSLHTAHFIFCLINVMTVFWSFIKKKFRLYVFKKLEDLFWSFIKNDLVIFKRKHRQFVCC